VAHRWAWQPFGTARTDVGSTPAPVFGYGGEQNDAETGLVNLRARYGACPDAGGDPSIGRFLSRDSIPGVMAVPRCWGAALRDPERTGRPS
jgi:hypothetical protein